jgi:CBS domain-containing protein
VRAQEIMTSPVITVAPQMAVREAAALLEQHGFTALPVVDAADGLVGIVTEADLLRHRIHRSPRSRFWHRHPTPEPPPGQQVSELMTSPAVAVSPQTDAAHLAELMLRDKLRSIPILRGNEVIGIVTRRDLLRTIVRTDDQIAAEVRQHLEVLSGPQRWTVSVADGVVDIVDEFDDNDRELTSVLADAVPGVAHTTIHSRTDR